MTWARMWHCLQDSLTGPDKYSMLSCGLRPVVNALHWQSSKDVKFRTARLMLWADTTYVNQPRWKQYYYASNCQEPFGSELVLTSSTELLWILRDVCSCPLSVLRCFLSAHSDGSPVVVVLGDDLSFRPSILFCCPAENLRRCCQCGIPIWKTGAAETNTQSHAVAMFFSPKHFLINGTNTYIYIYIYIYII